MVSPAQACSAARPSTLPTRRAKTLTSPLPSALAQDTIAALLQLAARGHALPEKAQDVGLPAGLVLHCCEFRSGSSLHAPPRPFLCPCCAVRTGTRARRRRAFEGGAVVG